MTSSLKPSLNKVRSGTFWRRKSSLGMAFGGNTPASPPSPATKGESVVEKERPLSPAPEDEIRVVQKRKSGTFWRRKSSLNLNNAFTAMNGKEGQPQDTGLVGGSTGAADGDTDGGKNNMANGKYGVEENVTVEDLDTEKPLPELEESLPPRSYSPPPQLPAFVGGGGGLGGEDMFKDIQ